ncbi:MAG: tRNA 4-thiouridine(8) synthase ThiI [Parcubacteria group bacterium]|nr:tRNA 4-thiouridine(8) synthase ThiI [Parcubacteria group bacterium]MCR4342342.1 tRNA 4-thiouridine(8) synthase ThiI [Patescibacteria group bacterium]
MEKNVFYDYAICHYDEIGLKGRNRKVFEGKLVDNIKNGLVLRTPGSFEYVKRISGRVIIKLSEKGKNDIKEIEEVLGRTFGIAYFTFAFSSSQDIGSIKARVLSLMAVKKFKTFRITSQRSKKDFPLTSQDINIEVGAHVLDNIKNIKVKLENPAINCFIEIADNFVFIYFDKLKGLGGLPIGISGKALLLVSGGIDSPVAAYYLMKRGLEVCYIHFHSLPYTSQSSLDKVESLVSVLDNFQYKSKIYFVPFSEIQKEVMLNAPDKFRIIFYRRFMFKIAEEVAKKEKIIALGTGEALGQVASQTVENLIAIEDAVKILILRPLIGFDKKEIIKKALEIGTYDISIIPHEDCCSLFLPKNPETKADLNEIKKAEKAFNIRKIVKEALKNIEIKKSF